MSIVDGREEIRNVDRGSDGNLGSSVWPGAGGKCDGSCHVNLGLGLPCRILYHQQDACPPVYSTARPRQAETGGDGKTNGWFE